MTNEERAQKWLERLWGKDISMPEPNALSLAAQFAEVEAPLNAELDEWRSGKRYMGGTGTQPGDLYSKHLRELGTVLGLTAGYIEVGTCNPIVDVKVRIDRIAALEAHLENIHELISAELEERWKKRSWERLGQLYYAAHERMQQDEEQ